MKAFEKKINELLESGSTEATKKQAVSIMENLNEKVSAYFMNSSKKFKIELYGKSQWHCEENVFTLDDALHSLELN